MVTVIILLVMILGWVIYMRAVDSKVSETGKIMFWTALLTLLFHLDVVVTYFRRL